MSLLLYMFIWNISHIGSFLTLTIHMFYVHKAFDSCVDITDTFKYECKQKTFAAYLPAIYG